MWCRPEFPPIAPARISSRSTPCTARTGAKRAHPERLVVSDRDEALEALVARKKKRGLPLTDDVQRAVDEMRARRDRPPDGHGDTPAAVVRTATQLHADIEAIEATPAKKGPVKFVSLPLPRDVPDMTEAALATLLSDLEVGDVSTDRDEMVSRALRELEQLSGRVWPPRRPPSTQGAQTRLVAMPTGARDGTRWPASWGAPQPLPRLDQLSAMSDVELQDALIDAGREDLGSREDLIARLRRTIEANEAALLTPAPSWSKNALPPKRPTASAPPPRGARPKRKRKRHLIVFAGSKEVPYRIAVWLEASDHEADERDIKNDPEDDVLAEPTALKLIADVAHGEYDSVFLAPECSSFSIAMEDEEGNPLELRTAQEPFGKHPIPDEWRTYLVKHNAISDLVADLIEVSEAVDVPWLCENSSGRSAAWGDARWDEFAHRGFLWDMPRFKQMPVGSYVQEVFPQCSKGSAFQAYTALRGSKHFNRCLADKFGGLTCACPRHLARAKGRGPDGASLSAAKAVYPPAMSGDLAHCIVCATEDAAERPPLRPPADAVAVELPPLFHASHPDEEGAVTRAEWRAATALATHGQADLASIAASSGAGWRLPHGRHVDTIESPRAATDPMAMKWLYECEKHVAKSSGRATHARPAFAWLLALLATSRVGAYNLVLGSSKPHAADARDARFQRTQRWAPSASLRQLEIEAVATLEGELLPEANTPPITEWEDPPERWLSPPGPFTTAELIPSAVVGEVTEYRLKVDALHARALRGANGWQAAKGLRPTPLYYTESEALNACGRGYTWRKRAEEDLWDVVQPSSWPHNPPHTSLNVQRCIDDALTSGYPDMQQTSWTANGYPGARAMPIQAVVSHSHVGAIKETAAFIKCADKDIGKQFVTHGYDFPDHWPCTIDPMNVVIQNGSARLCIDKSLCLARRQVLDEDGMWLVQEDGTFMQEPVPAYNSYIDLAADKLAGVRVRFIRVWEAGRATAILATTGFTVKVGKFDLSSFFRMHGKQLSHVHQSGRLIPQRGYGTDMCNNFGECDAPDHDCRESNFLTYMVRIELQRLETRYPPRDKGLLGWLRRRRQALAGAEVASYRVDWLHYCAFYVDDAFLTVVDDPIFAETGEAVYALVQETRVQQTRAELYYEAAMGVANYYGHDTPESKQSPMGQLCEYLGTILEVAASACAAVDTADERDEERRKAAIDVIARSRRFLGAAKRESYLAQVRACQRGKTTLAASGQPIVPHDELNSLLHKLTHAAETIPSGRQRLFYLKRAAKGAGSNRLDGNMAIIDPTAARELRWWEEQLQRSTMHGLPLASRYDFPAVSSDDHIIEYHDASRELDSPEPSGYGAWTVIRDVLYYILGEFTEDEIREYSINVLESATRDMATFTFVAFARSIGCSARHTTGYNDNTCAEFNAEFGRPGTPLLHAMLLRRQERLLSMGLHAANERCASIDNDVADLLSRGRLDEALRHAEANGIPAQRLHVGDDLRRLGL